jgi:branched-chain amino acid transport system substrate-binding protein
MITKLTKLLSVGALALGASFGSARAADTVKVGVLHSLSGTMAISETSLRDVLIFTADEINAKGGVLGKKIELVTEDNQSKAGESATVVKKMISRDKVVAILGEVASSRSLEAAPICQAAKIPQISPSSTNPAVTETGDYIFRVCFIDPFQGVVMAKFAKNTLKVRKVAVLTSVSSAYSVGLAKYFKERFAADGGTIAIEQKYSEGDKDFKAQLTAVKAAGIEGIFVPGYYTEAALICKQAKDLGLQVPVFGGDGWEAPQLIEIGGAAMEGTYFSTHYSAENKTPAITSFLEKFKQRFNQETPDAMAALGYDSALVLIDAIKRAGTTESAKLREAIATTKGYTGVTGTTTLDAQRNANKAAVVVAVKGGKFTFVEAVAP